MTGASEQVLRLTLGSATLEGALRIPEGATGIVLFAHGSGSSRHSPRNRYVAQALQEGGLATLLIDLLTSAEEREDDRTARLRFNIRLLADRVSAATGWLLAKRGHQAFAHWIFRRFNRRSRGPRSGGRAAG